MFVCVHLREDYGNVFTSTVYRRYNNMQDKQVWQ